MIDFSTSSVAGINNNNWITGKVKFIGLYDYFLMKYLLIIR